MNEKKNTRIDKWLWAVRIFKTRSLATRACCNNKVKINNSPIKPSFKIKKGDLIQIRKGPIKYSYLILQIAEKRMSAKNTFDFIKDITSEDEKKKKITVNKLSILNRKQGTGRPTKKERRILDKHHYKGNIN